MRHKRTKKEREENEIYIIISMWTEYDKIRDRIDIEG